MSETLVIPVTPLGKPRMTRRDKWAKRKCVEDYFTFANGIRALAQASHFTLPEYGLSLKFYLPMPRTWTVPRKRAMDGRPHQQKPDIDNLIKAVLDPLLDEDKTVWQLTAEKRWAETGRIELSISELDANPTPRNTEG